MRGSYTVWTGPREVSWSTPRRPRRPLGSPKDCRRGILKRGISPSFAGLPNPNGERSPIISGKIRSTISYISVRRRRRAAKFASLDYKVLESKGKYSLAEVRRIRGARTRSAFRWRGSLTPFTGICDMEALWRRKASWLCGRIRSPFLIPSPKSGCAFWPIRPKAKPRGRPSISRMQWKSSENCVKKGKQFISP